MEEVLKPETTKDVEAVVKWAAAEDRPLEVVGQGSKRDLGRPVQTAHVLDLSALTGIESYEPAELVLTVKAGTPIAEIEALVEENGQELSFEPMDYAPLLAGVPGQGTVGGVLATNLSGPRRIKAGAARDHILGMEAVSGRGGIFNSGGKVVKNVTGYDLPRALCGSYGTLAIATTVTLKVNPKPETSASFVLHGLSDGEAVRALCLAMGSSAEVSGAAHLPAGPHGDPSRTVLRLEGFRTSVDYRFESLKTLLHDFGKAERLEEEASRQLWLSVRDVQPFANLPNPVWRVSLAPAKGPDFVKRLQEIAEIAVHYDWSGGLVWVMCLDGDLHDHDIRRAVGDAGGGHATLVRAGRSHRSDIAVFEPQAAPLAALSKRLKEQFDPKGILNPGRMVSGI